MTSRTYVFRLSGDFSQLESASAAAGGAVDGLTGKTDGFAQAQARADKAADKSAKTLRGYAATGKLTAQELTQVGFQLNDFAVQVASGQNALIAAVQQGSQLSGTFGGIGNAARALLSLLTPVRLAVGGLAAGFGTVAFAAVQGYREQATFERSLLLTGNRAGITSKQFQDLSRSIAASTSATVGASRQALQAVVSTGAFGPEEIEAVTRAVVLFSERTGQSADEVAKDFARMGDSATRFALERNKSLNFLTAAQLRYIRNLEAEGKAEEARIEVARLLADQLGKKTPTELGYLETSLKGVKKAASEFWDALLDIGRPETLDQKLNSAIDAAIAAQRRLEEVEGQRFKFKGDVDNRRAVFAEAKAKVDALRAQRDAERSQAAQAAADAKRNAKEIAESSREYVDSTIAVQRAGYARSAAVREVALARESSALEEQFERLEISQERYVDRRYAIERAAIDLKAQQIDQEAALEQRRVVENSAERNAAAARLVEIEARRLGLAKEYVELDERRRRGELAGRPRNVPETAQASFRLDELGQTQAVSDAIVNSYRERREASRQISLDIAAGNQQLAVSMIRDDRTRGEVQIAIEEATLRKRLDLAILNAEERARAEDMLAQYVGLRNAQLTEELKPQWQRMVEGWRDTQRLMRESSDEFQLNFLRTSEQTFVQFVRTGKASLQSLADMVLESAARFTFQSAIGPSLSSLGSTIAQGLGMGTGTASAGSAAAAAAATSAQTAAITASTASLTAQTTALSASAAALGSEAAAAAALSAAHSSLTASAFSLSVAADLASVSLQTMAATASAGDGGGGWSALAAAVVSSFAADGAVFRSPGVAQFARGGVVNGPTLFKFAQGGQMRNGLMGEAGPEAIMPLERGPDGKLGVTSFAPAGGREPNITINIIGATEKPETRTRRSSNGDLSIDVIYGQMKARLGAEIREGYGLAHDIQYRFGGSGAANLSR